MGQVGQVGQRRLVLHDAVELVEVYPCNVIVYISCNSHIYIYI